MLQRVTIGLLIDQLASGYARLLIAGVSDGCRAAGANLVVFSGRAVGSTRGDEYQDNVIFDYIKPGTVDALVMATGTQGTFLTSEQLSAFALHFRGLPLVSIGLSMPGAVSILSDNRMGIHSTLDHLTAVHRARRVAIMNGPELNVESATRFEAYRDAVRAHDLDEDPELWLRGDFTRMRARQVLSEYLERKGKPDFQALLATNDEMAIGCIQVLREHGFSVPGEVAVTGYDNIADAQFVVPSMTTVDQELRGQGRRAADLGVRLAQGEPQPQEIVLPTTLVLRTSCGCLPSSVLSLDALPRSSRRGTPRSVDALRIADRCMARLTGTLPQTPATALRATMARLAAEAGTEAFLRTLLEALNTSLAAGVDVAPWQEVLSLLHGELVKEARTSDEVVSLQTAFQKVLALLSEVLRLEQGRRFTELQGHTAQLRRVMERLISAPSVEEFMNGVAEELYRLDIRTCLIACYPHEVRHGRGEAWEIPERAEMVLVYVDRKRIFPAEAERVFQPADRFLPPRFLPGERPFIFITAPLFFREDQIGYVAFEPGGQDSAIYEAFCVQLGALLKASLLFATRERMIETLASEREKILRLAALVESSEDAIFGVDLQGLITSWNRGAERVFGYTAQEIVGQSVSALVGAQTPPGTNGFWESARAGRPVPAFEVPARRKDGSGVSVSYSLAPIRDERGGIAGIAVVGRDLTAEKAVQVRLIQAQRLESLGMLAGGIAHQFNNINMVIQGYLSALLESPELVPATIQLGLEAQKGVTRLVDITERLQGLTSPGRAGEQMCRLSALVSAQLPLFHKRLAESGTTLDLDLSETGLVRMDCSRANFLLTSLMENALDSLMGRPERRISIRTLSVHGSACLEVTDTGCGIPGDDLQKLFSPFFTTKGEWASPGSSQARAKGVGLSLSVCRSTVSESGGNVEVESEIGVGSTFRVWLPVADAGSSPERHPEQTT